MTAARESSKRNTWYGGGSLITIEPTAVNSNGTQYTTTDNLGSPRVITNSSGAVVSRHDYQPFGTELGAGMGGRTTAMGFSGSGDDNRKQFTGYERDSETGLDFAQARYYSSTQGRFTSADAVAGSIANPLTSTISQPNSENIRPRRNSGRWVAAITPSSIPHNSLNNA